MDKIETTQLALEVLAKHGFTDVNKHNVSMELEYTKFNASIYIYDDVCQVEFWGGSISKSTPKDYTLSEAHDLKKFNNRLRTVSKNALKHEAEIKKDKDKDFVKYKQIHETLVEEKIAFALNIKKDTFSSAAVTKINGYETTFRHLDGTLTLMIGGIRVNVPAEMAVEIINMLPAYKKE